MATASKRSEPCNEIVCITSSLEVLGREVDVVQLMVMMTEYVAIVSSWRSGHATSIQENKYSA